MDNFNYNCFVEDFVADMRVGFSIPAQSRPPRFVGLNLDNAKRIFDMARQAGVEPAYSFVKKDDGFTEKQRALILKYLYKYRKQYAAAGIDILKYLENPKWRTPLKVIPYAVPEICLDKNQNIWKVAFRYQSNDHIKGLIQTINDVKFMDAAKITWNISQRYWEIANVEPGRELALYLKNNLPGILISSDDQKILQQPFKDYDQKYLVDLENNELIIHKFVNGAQKQLAEKVLNSNLSLYKKINKLVFLEFEISEKVKNFLSKQLNHCEINILCSRTVNIDLSENFSKTELINLHQSFFKLNLGQICENTNYHKSFYNDIRFFWKSQKYSLKYKKQGLYTDTSINDYDTDMDFYKSGVNRIENQKIFDQSWKPDNNQEFGVLLTKSSRQLFDDGYMSMLIEYKDVSKISKSIDGFRKHNVNENFYNRYEKVVNIIIPENIK